MNYAQWEKLIDERGRTGLSVASFCAEKSLSVAAYYSAASTIKQKRLKAASANTPDYPGLSNGNGHTNGKMIPFVSLTEGLIEIRVGKVTFALPRNDRETLFALIDHAMTIEARKA